MAEVTALRNNCLPYPVYAAPWGIAFSVFDADGDLVTGMTTPDSEVSLNGDTFADCTNEAVEIATSSGMYYLLLTAAELTADVVSIIVKSATSGMKTTPIVLYPRKLVTIRSGTSAGGAAGYITLDASASAVDDYYNGMVCIATIDTNVEVRVISDYTGSSKQAAVVPNCNVVPDADDTFIIKLPEGVQINQANATHVNSTAQTAGDLAAMITTVDDFLDTEVAAILADTNELQIDWVDGGRLDLILDARASQTSVDTIDNFLDTEIGSPSDFGSGASLAKNLFDIEAQTDDIGAAGAGLTDLGGMSTTMKAQVETEANDALVANNLDHVALTATGIPAIPAGTYIDQMMDDGTAVYDRTTDSLQAIRDRGDAAWDTADVSALALQTSVDDLEGRLSATRAGYLDNLSAGAVALEATAQSILTDTAVIGAAGAGLTAVPWNATWDAEVQSEVDDALDTTVADSVPADGTRPTFEQALYMIWQFLAERSVSGTTVTVKKADGSTGLMTFTLDDATTPTSITRAT